jgi:hypothetical protein
MIRVLITYANGTETIDVEANGDPLRALSMALKIVKAKQRKIYRRIIKCEVIA